MNYLLRLTTPKFSRLTPGPRFRPNTVFSLAYENKSEDKT